MISALAGVAPRSSSAMQPASDLVMKCVDFKRNRQQFSYH